MKPRRRRIKVYATGAHRGALEQPRKCKNKRRKPISQLPGSAGSQQRAEDQAQIERPDVNQLALEDVGMPSEVPLSHPAGVVAMRKAPLDQRASLPEQALAIGPVHPLPVGVDGPLLLLLALPVPLPPLLLLRNIRSYFRPLHLR